MDCLQSATAIAQIDLIAQTGEYFSDFHKRISNILERPAYNRW
jgi:hypothetical protein